MEEKRINILNHPTWGNPSNTGDNGGNAGQITRSCVAAAEHYQCRVLKLCPKYTL